MTGHAGMAAPILDTQRDAFTENMEVIGVRVGAKQRKAMPQIQTERLAVKNVEKGSPCRIRLDVEEGTKVGQERGKLGFGKWIIL